MSTNVSTRPGAADHHHAKDGWDRNAGGAQHSEQLRLAQDIVWRLRVRSSRWAAQHHTGALALEEECDVGVTATEGGGSRGSMAKPGLIEQFLDWLEADQRRLGKLVGVGEPASDVARFTI
jgi:hypothetical protein